MALVSGTERELLLPLYAGAYQPQGWDLFLQRLRAQVRADRVLLLIAPGGGLPIRLLQSHGRDASPLTLDAISTAISTPISAIRPRRVYALQELLGIEAEAVAAGQRIRLEKLDIAYARLMRVMPGGDCISWLHILHSRTDFGAADSALMSALVPHLEAAIAARLAFDDLAMRAALAEDVLSRLGIRQTPLMGPGEGIATVTQNRDGTPVLIQPAPPAPPEALRWPAGVARERLDAKRPGDAASIAALHHLSQREAVMALRLSQGASLIEAGRAAGLTNETARNYSKRIYAKTGAAGQADLVRIILGGLSPLA